MLEGREERFGNSVIERRADPSHRLGDPELLTRLSKRVRGVLLRFKGSKQDFAVEQTLEALPWLQRVSSSRGFCVVDC